MVPIMKSFFKYIWSLAESIGKARAATYFTRIGRSDLARELMLKD
jgi:hypothetical protein